MSINHYFEGRKTFIIEAENKQDALEKGKLYVLRNPMYYRGNYDTNDIKVDKKLNNKKKTS